MSKAYNGYFDTDFIMLERMSKLILTKSKSNAAYRSQIESALSKLAEVCQSDVPNHEYRYEITNEYSDIALAELTEDGPIIVNKGKK